MMQNRRENTYVSTNYEVEEINGVHSIIDSESTLNFSLREAANRPSNEDVIRGMVPRSKKSLGSGTLVEC